MIIEKLIRSNKINPNITLLLPRHAETPECWSLELKLAATFADKFGHICRQTCIISIFLQKNHVYLQTNRVYLQTNRVYLQTNCVYLQTNRVYLQTIYDMTKIL